MIRVFHPGPDHDFLPIPDPGSRGSKRHRILIRNTANMYVPAIQRQLRGIQIRMYRMRWGEGRGRNEIRLQ
jgi:hypothetical protein